MAASEMHDLIRATVRRFAREHLRPHAAQWDRESRFPREALAELAKLGFGGVAIPEAWGGAGMDHTALAIVIEEIAAGEGATSTIVQVNNLAAGILLGYGSDAQKERW